MGMKRRQRANPSDSLQGAIVFRLARSLKDDRAAATLRGRSHPLWRRDLILDYRSVRYWVWREPCTVITLIVDGLGD